MSILIKGMEMPTNCGERKAFVCYRQWAGDSGDCFCGITKSDAKAKERNADCPLVPVPPHGRLGDLDALHKLFLEKAKEYKGAGGAMVAMAALCIANAPTIIPASEEVEP